MEETNILNQFRDNWKKELQSKPDFKVESEKQGVQLGEKTTEGKSDSNRNTQIETAVSKASYTCLTYDFKTHTSVCDPDFSVPGSSISSQNEVSTGKSDKRKCKINPLGSKKTKVSKLDDIFSEKAKGVIPKERLLDQLIQDIDEITAIPFFDISIPKEVAINIFQFLDIKDLCSCAQVSKSWRVLSEDELLWCRICHRLGRETIYTTREKQNWKTIVQHNVERQRRLMSNWKERIGKISQLEHIRGKILCSVNSCKENIVAGYSNGEVKYWDLTSGDSCVLQPSNTSLRLLDDYEGGTEQNTLQSVVTSNSTIAALYSQGNVEIWNLDKGTQAVQTYSPSTSQFQVSCFRMSNNSHTLVTKYGHFLDVLHRQDPEGEFDLHTHFTTETQICDIKLLEIDREIPPVVLSKLCSVSIFHPKQSEDLLTIAKDKSEQLSHMTEIHSRVDIPVSLFDIKAEPALVAVSLGSSSCDEEDWFKIYLYDLQTCKLTQSLQSYGTYGGCSMNTTCMNLADSPPNELIIAQTDKKLHIYDLRQGIRIQTLEGHPQKITRVQMDDWKVVSGGAGSYGYGSVVYIWDRRMGKKLWDLHNRHPVEYCHFRDKHLIVGNVPVEKHPRDDEFEVASHRKYRGSIHVYDFLEDLTTQDVPEICLSTYDQPGASHYNIGLAMPYDTLNF